MTVNFGKVQIVWKYVCHDSGSYQGAFARKEHQATEALIEYFVTTRMAATRIGFSRPAGFDLGLRNSGHLRLLHESISCFVSCVFRLQCGGCKSRAQNLKFRAQNFDVHRSNPQRSGTPYLISMPNRLDDRGTGQWKWMEEVPRRTSLVPLAFPCFLHFSIGVEFRLPGAGGGSFPLYGGTFARSYSVSISQDPQKILRTYPFLGQLLRTILKIFWGSWNSWARGPPNSWKNAPRMEGQMKCLGGPS